MDLEALTHKPAVTCGDDVTIADVARIMRDSGAGSVVVIDAHGRLSGIVTDRDIVIRGVAGGRALGAPVTEVMTAEPAFVYEQQDVVAAHTIMVERECRRLPVLDAAGAIVGVIALDDLLQAYARQIDALARVVGTAGAWQQVA